MLCCITLFSNGCAIYETCSLEQYIIYDIQKIHAVIIKKLTRNKPF